MNIAMSKEDM